MALPIPVARAIQLLLGLVVLGLVTTVLVVVFRDELLEAWTRGHPEDSMIQPPAFVPVAIVLYVVFAGLTLTLLPFLRSRHNWARHSLAAMIVFIAISTLAGIRTDPPLVFVLCSVVSLVLDGAILFYLWHKDTSRYVGRDPVAATRDS